MSYCKTSTWHCEWRSIFLRMQLSLKGRLEKASVQHTSLYLAFLSCFDCTVMRLLLFFKMKCKKTNKKKLLKDNHNTRRKWEYMFMIKLFKMIYVLYVKYHKL